MPNKSIISNISGWYRVAIMTSILWIILSLIKIEPWLTLSIRTRRGGARYYNNWDEFLLFGILPIVIFWGFLWIIKGFKKTRVESNNKNETTKITENDTKSDIIHEEKVNKENNKPDFSDIEINLKNILKENKSKLSDLEIAGISNLFKHFEKQSLTQSQLNSRLLSYLKEKYPQLTINGIKIRDLK